MHLPSSVRSYTDFFVGIHHAEEAGRIFKLNPLLPRSYASMPLGYNGRASSVRVRGEGVRRPLGQRLIGDRPEFGASRWPGFGLELRMLVAGAHALGATAPLGEAEQRLADYCPPTGRSAAGPQLWGQAASGE